MSPPFDLCPTAFPLVALLCAACSASSGEPSHSASQASPGASLLPPGAEVLKRSTFKDQRSIPWLPFYDAPASGSSGVKDGAYCLRIDHPGKHRWDVQFRHREMTIAKEHNYAVRFSAWSSVPINVHAKVGMSGAPYTEYWSKDIRLTPSRAEFSDTFKYWLADDPAAELAFHLADASATLPAEICFDDLHLTDPEFVADARAATAKVPAIRVDQVGYFPRGPKRATWVLEGADAEAKAGKPVAFELVAASGAVIHRGMTQPFGRDPTSGTYVQRLDFSPVTTPGEGLRLRLATGEGDKDSVVSDAFSIDAGLLRPLSRDALRYFYYTRSGIALEQPYVEGQAGVRPIGHPTDSKVACAPDAGCSHELDVSGGWYDAGDYGKYVVNGGLSTWLLLNLWEVAHRNGWAVVGMKDGDLNIPESKNGKPDLLDEARWELEWMLKMQVPEGDPQAGLVHHKLHDTAWSALGTLPVLSGSTQRQLRPVSTAATLNLAAVGAQAARVFATLDPKLAERCLAAAKRAWAAAESHPALFITLADNHGGGAYEDDDVSDERFWAATELYLTTGEEGFLAVLGKSPHFLHPRIDAAVPGLPQAMDWRATDALATVALALDAKRAPAAAREGSKKAIVEIAERYLALSSADAFGQPYTGTHYTWGSNSFILNNGIVMAYAHALTKDPRFLEGAVASLDYVLGRNALGKSYVSGYGTRPLQNPHHRFWAHSIDPKFPSPPPGVVSGGPNSDLQDPYSKASNLGCIGQMCYVDHIDAYSANEVAINWNAELAWLVAYLGAVL